jgi:hypothetical protein
MQVYKTKVKRLTGTDFQDVRKKAFGLHEQIRKKTKRRPYIRSAYFNREKIFLGLFWDHLFDKQNWRDRVRRLKYFPAGIELIQNTRFDPITKENPNKAGEVLHRFAGITSDNHLFYVQIKEDKRKGQKWLISVFPEDG